MERFRLARMSAAVAASTWVLLALGLAVPLTILIIAPTRTARWLAPAGAVFIWSVFAMVRGLYRPREFIVAGDGLRIVWPWRTRAVLREEIVSVRLVQRKDLGRTMRVFGAGGLWGSFGRYHSQHLGQLELYASRGRDMVLIERTAGGALVLTPERPVEFIAALKL